MRRWRRPAPPPPSRRVPGHTETIQYEDEKGHWHTETAAGTDRPDTDVEDTN
jgi:hypothetical protein